MPAKIETALSLAAVCRGEAETIAGRAAKSGIFKYPLSGPVMVDEGGIVGDRVMNRKHHGGPDQALLIDGQETIARLETLLGHALPPGTLGENLVIRGLDTAGIAIGDRFRIGDVLVEASAPRMPCSTLAARMADPGIVKRYLAAGLPGIYARVIEPGFLAVGDPVEIIARTGERVSVVEVMRALAGKVPDATRARILASPVASRVRVRLSP